MNAHGARLLSTTPTRLHPSPPRRARCARPLSPRTLAASRSRPRSRPCPLPQPLSLASPDAAAAAAAAPPRHPGVYPCRAPPPERERLPDAAAPPRHRGHHLDRPPRADPHRPPRPHSRRPPWSPPRPGRPPARYPARLRARYHPTSFRAAGRFTLWVLVPWCRGGSSRGWGGEGRAERVGRVCSRGVRALATAARARGAFAGGLGSRLCGGGDVDGVLFWWGVVRVGGRGEEVRRKKERGSALVVAAATASTLTLYPRGAPSCVVDTRLTPGAVAAAGDVSAGGGQGLEGRRRGGPEERTDVCGGCGAGAVYGWRGAAQRRQDAAVGRAAAA